VGERLMLIEIYLRLKHFMLQVEGKKNNYGQQQRELLEKVNFLIQQQILEYIIKIEHLIIMQLNM
jgi:hypothetical protein